MELSQNLIYRDASFANRDAFFEQVVSDLLEGGYVKADYAQALRDREAKFPTGLPVPGGVAIPHTDSSHVLKDTIAIATLKQPLDFGEMGGDVDDTVPVSLIILLALTDAAGHLAFLSKTIKAIQDGAFVDALKSAASVDEIQHLISRKLTI
jgi:PTS system galactitol-specific IIA component